MSAPAGSSRLAVRVSLSDGFWAAWEWLKARLAPLMLLAALTIVGLILGGVLPGGTTALWIELVAATAVVLVVYDARRTIARRSVGTIRVVPPAEVSDEERPRAAELVRLVEEQIALCGVPPAPTGSASPLPPLGPVLAATDDAKGRVLGAAIDRLPSLLTPPSGHDLSLTLLAPGADGRHRLGMTLVDRDSGNVDINEVVRGEDVESAAREAAFRAYIHASRHACRRGAAGRAAAWASSESLAGWDRLRESRDIAALGRLARDEPGNAPIRIRLAQLLVKGGRWPAAVERYLEILASGDVDVRPDVQHRLAIALARRPGELEEWWERLGPDDRRRLWRDLRAAVAGGAAGGGGDDPPEARVAADLLALVGRLCAAVEGTSRHALPRRPMRELRGMRESARVVHAIADVELARLRAPGDDGRAIARATEAAGRVAGTIRADATWQPHYNAACLACRAGLPLERAMGHVRAVVTDPEWRQAPRDVVAERRRWLFNEDPDLEPLRHDDGPAGRDFRHLRARLRLDETGVPVRVLARIDHPRR